jgi:hypothetical protein
MQPAARSFMRPSIYYRGLNTLDLSSLSLATCLVPISDDAGSCRDRRVPSFTGSVRSRRCVSRAQRGHRVQLGRNSVLTVHYISDLLETIEDLGQLTRRMGSTISGPAERSGPGRCRNHGRFIQQLIRTTTRRLGWSRRFSQTSSRELPTVAGCMATTRASHRRMRS